MATKIEIAKSIKYSISNCKSKVQNALGNSFDKELKTFKRNTYIDKYNYKFSTTKHHSSPAVYFDCYSGYYGDSNVSMLDDNFYIECLCRALTNLKTEIIAETEKIMDQKYIVALQEAKKEAEDIIKEYDALTSVEGESI